MRRSSVLLFLLQGVPSSGTWGLSSCRNLYLPYPPKPFPVTYTKETGTSPKCQKIFPSSVANGGCQSSPSSWSNFFLVLQLSWMKDYKRRPTLVPPRRVVKGAVWSSWTTFLLWSRTLKAWPDFRFVSILGSSRSRVIRLPKGRSR